MIKTSSRLLEPMWTLRRWAPKSRKPRQDPASGDRACAPMGIIGVMHGAYFPVIRNPLVS
jgi:hypothetical protein